MKTSILTLAAILGISQSYGAGTTLREKKSSEDKHFSHPEFRQSERGDPSEDSRGLEHATELKNRLETHSLPKNFWDFEKLEEESQKRTDKNHYDSSKEDRGDPLRGTWVDGESEENSLRKPGFWDRETGKDAPQNSLPPLAAPSSEARLPQPSPQAPAPQKPEETMPPSEKTIRDAGEWPI